MIEDVFSLVIFLLVVLAVLGVASLISDYIIARYFRDD